jgi:hypothetical protein
MALSRQQVHTIIATALPGEQADDIRLLPGGRVAVQLAGGDAIDIQTYASQQAASTASAAMRRLRGEFDSALPALRASDVAGDIVGVPYVLHSALHGEPLPQLVERMSEQALYELGRSLGNLVYSIHRVACEQYGELGGQDGYATEREYVLRRVGERLDTARNTRLLSDHQANELGILFDQQFVPAGNRAALVVGALTVDTILVRHDGGHWRLGGLTGWHGALGWSPAWDHISLLESARQAAFFSLRVGYGNGYDDQTARTYEQVREAALRPYRALLALEQALAAQAAGDRAEMRRNRSILIGLMQLLPTDGEPQRPSTA